MPTSALVTILILCAVLLVFGGVLLLLAVATLWLLMRGGSTVPADAPSAPLGSPPPFRSPPQPPPVPHRLENNMAHEEDEEVAKTEVFMRRGSMNLDWEDDGGEDATELFRADVHGVGLIEE